MSKDLIQAELFARARGICSGTLFTGEILGRAHVFSFAEHQVRVRLPAATFASGSNNPVGTSATLVRLRRSRVDDPAPERSYYEIDYLTVEVDFPEAVLIPSALLDHEAVQKLPKFDPMAPELDRLADNYDALLLSAWRHWLRIVRWATNQYKVGLPDWTSDGSDDLQLCRIHERTTGYGVWAPAAGITLQRAAYVNAARWEHIGDVLASERTPPIWFEYMAEATQRLTNQDFSGCVLSSVIACETLVRAIYRYLLGNPANAAAAELADRTAAQAIIAKWKDLTGLKAGGAVHQIFDIRNGLVHSGRTDSIDEKIAKDTIKTASKFVEQGDEWWFDEHQISNPRTVVPD